MKTNATEWKKRRPVGLIVKKKCPKSDKNKRNCVEERRPMGLSEEKKYVSNGTVDMVDEKFTLFK